MQQFRIFLINSSPLQSDKTNENNLQKCDFDRQYLSEKAKWGRLKWNSFTDLSDHLPIFAVKRDTVLKQKLEKVKITTENKALIMADLSQESWYKIDTFNYPWESYSFFHQKLNHFYKAFSLKLSTIKENKMKTKPWLTKGLLKPLKTKKQTVQKINQNSNSWKQI